MINNTLFYIQIIHWSESMSKIKKNCIYISIGIQTIFAKKENSLADGIPVERVSHVTTEHKHLKRDVSYMNKLIRNEQKIK